MSKITLPPLRYVFFALALSALTLHAGAQAVPTAVRSSSVDVYAAGAVSQSDFDSTDKGFVLGGDFTYHFRYFDTSLDIRYDHVTGNAVGEKSFDGGIRIAKQYRRYHPYGHLLIGYGIITFDHPSVNPDGSIYASDNSTIYNFGGGVDIDLTRRFALKVDAQYQYWNLGSRSDVGAVHFNPTIGSIGIIYHLPYRFLRPRRY